MEGSFSKGILCSFHSLNSVVLWNCSLMASSSVIWTTGPKGGQVLSCSELQSINNVMQYQYVGLMYTPCSYSRAILNGTSSPRWSYSIHFCTKLACRPRYYIDNVTQCHPKSPNVRNDSILTFLLLITSGISSAAGLPYSSSGVNWKGITWCHSSTRLPCWKERRPKWDDRQCRHDAGDEQEVSRVSSTLHSTRNFLIKPQFVDF